MHTVYYLDGMEQSYILTRTGCNDQITLDFDIRNQRNVYRGTDSASFFKRPLSNNFLSGTITYETSIPVTSKELRRCSKVGPEPERYPVYLHGRNRANELCFSVNFFNYWGRFVFEIRN